MHALSAFLARVDALEPDAVCIAVLIAFVAFVLAFWAFVAVIAWMDSKQEMRPAPPPSDPIALNVARHRRSLR